MGAARYGTILLVQAMTVTIRLYGTLRRFSQPDTPGCWHGDVPAGTTIQGLMRQIGVPEREVAAASLNGSVCPFETEIPPDATILLVTPIGAG
ncbi:hypothetical protein GF339_22790 [candidate division KSB3 bacterium]|uniref:Ubiquitin Mut7-C domain-containing protein n=1 Tax=candidate division KSB3 bacterium TaxID=2044937 RepID=A0A9D5K0Y3_9BACT|nr:hypothetical protein [candidate division KSB3 bacterium]MBD3327431.1 hypothetical protein [candidate division KSB3 bacterium]